MTAHIYPDPQNSAVDTYDGIVEFHAAIANQLDDFIQFSNGSLRLNVYTRASTDRSQADAALALVQQIIHHLGGTVGFTLTLHVPDSSVNIVKAVGRRPQPQLIRQVDTGPAVLAAHPAILAAHVSHVDSETMVLSGHNLTGGRIWCFQDHAFQVEYLLEKKSDQGMLLECACSSCHCKRCHRPHCLQACLVWTHRVQQQQSCSEADNKQESQRR